MGQRQSELTDSDQARKNEDWNPSLEDIELTKSMLIYRFKLPIEVVDDILSLAEYWSSDELVYDQLLTIYESRRVLIRIDDLFEELDYLHLVRPVGFLSEEEKFEEVIRSRKQYSLKLKRIQWKINAHDQGWSSYPADHGTFRNSWTWFEAMVTADGDSQDLSQSSDQEDWHQICKNFHAVSEFREQTIIWKPDHSILKKINQALLDRLSNDGNSNNSFLKIGITVRAVAQFPGWANTIQRVKCQFFYSI
ncbi:hypothetical protein BY996DRAFT_7595577 [Phakopsora pachyrhizi]|uniref:Expressed protein n=1 Tax=Phakopsora pachyrhizi TaxID=170000 RepID=A0AAV0ALE8_PHAPC|nr:hypothetical protein BY996DRAFT_7633336 [Phakopsora pachyrhizi]KAI8448410.1 hypothetical protein BY996DRAFT_7595577 [Phakopsora pachyrhizi]CAH7668919.1 expressed protein [Phakopsora pachyrhizi]